MSITIACVLKSGGIYNEKWVDRLKKGVAANLPIEHNFVCLTDMKPDCETKPLVNDWPKWWPKIELFRPKQFTGLVLYLDLDVIVTGSLLEIVTHPHRFTMCHDYYKPHEFNSTAMAWDADREFLIYEHFVKSPKHHMARYIGGPGRKIGDQGFIQDWLIHAGCRPKTFRELFGARSIVSYKADHCHNGPPAGAVAVAFHGKPKPSDIKVGWVKEAWDGRNIREASAPQL